MVDVTRPGHHRGRVPANKGRTFPVEILTTVEVKALLGQCSETTSLGIRDRALITMQVTPLAGVVTTAERTKVYRELPAAMLRHEALAVRPHDPRRREHLGRV
jgi:hypothetical protein